MVQKVIISILLILVWPMASFAGEMVVKKIVLGQFKVKNGSINISKSTPNWPEVNRHNLTMDDIGKIYLLNGRNKEIIIFNHEGNIDKKVALSIEKGKLLSDVENLNSSLEVSGNGERFLVGGFIFSKEGKFINEVDIVFPDIRLCNKTYINLQAPYVYDDKFQKIGNLMPKFADTEGHYDVDFKNKRKTLIKYSKDGKKLWEKQFAGYFAIIGVDARNNLYLSGVLKKGNPRSLYKLNSKGVILAQAPIPDPFPLLTQEEKDESLYSSEEFLSFFKLACNGNVYLIFQLSELPKRTYQRWLKGGEYFIYKFETKDQ